MYTAASDNRPQDQMSAAVFAEKKIQEQPATVPILLINAQFVDSSFVKKI